MKRIAVIFISLLFVGGLSAQGLYFGARGTFNSTWLFNKHISTEEYAPSFGSNYGGVLGYKLGKKVGAELNLLLNRHSQKYKGELGTGESFKSETVLNTFDIPLYLKFGEDVYFELGAVFSFMTYAEFFKKDGTGSITWVNEEVDAIEEFNNANISASAGLGVQPEILDGVRLLLGVRLVYGFIDMEGVDSEGMSIETLNTINQTTYKTANLSCGLGAGLIIEL